MVFYKLSLILMLYIQHTISYEGTILIREKRKAYSDIQTEAGSFEGSDGESKLNPLSRFYSSGMGSAEESGHQSGSGYDQSASAEEEIPRKIRNAGESGSGEGSSSGDIDSSFAELLRSNEKRSTDADGDYDDALSFENEKKRKEETISKGKRGKEENGIKRRDLEGMKGMSILAEFFKLMGSNDLKVTKRGTNEMDVENGDNSYETKFENEKRSVGEESRFDIAEGERKAAVTNSEAELRISKREVEDIGDETLPNLSYMQGEKTDKKAIELENDALESGELKQRKRNVVDGDNDIRLLGEVNMESLFTKQEHEMLERITGGTKKEEIASKRRSRNGGNGVNDLGIAREELPLIRIKSQSQESDDNKMKFAKVEKWQETEPQTGDNAMKRETRQTEESPLLSKRGLLHSDLNTFAKARQEFTNQKEGIQAVFRKMNEEKIEKRNVVYDDDLDADNFMANFGRPHLAAKEKRYLQNEDLAKDIRTKISQPNLMMDNTGSLQPLGNEYLENLMREREKELESEKLKNETGSFIDNESKVNERSPVNGITDASTDSMMAEGSEIREKGYPRTRGLKKGNDKHLLLKEDLVIGTFAKPTKVSGYWSGLGSKPIFVKSNADDEPDEMTSGSGKEESEVLKQSGLRRSKNIHKKKFIRRRKEFRPEMVGEIMDGSEGEMEREKETKGKRRSKEMKENKDERKRKKRMDKENGNEEMKYENREWRNAEAIVAFDELHEVVSKKKDNISKKRGWKVEKKKEDENGKKYNDDDNADEVSGDDDEESGEEMRKEIRSYEDDDDDDDDVIVKTLSANYRENDVIDKRSKIVVKRAPNDIGYIGCYVDVLHPIRDLAVRAGIPFVTINNCRSACRRTGYYYAGLQFGYLCFCGNNYGKYDMAPDSECNYACSGDSNQTCGGLWRNSIYFTAGAPIKSNEGPVPFYLPPQDQGIQENVKRSAIPRPANATQFSSAQNATQTNNDSNVTENTRQNLETAQAASPENPPAINTTANTVALQPSNQNASQVEKIEPKKQENGKRKVLMHFAYLHPQEHNEIAPTKPPAPTPPLRIEPQTRVFKGEIKLQQKWFDEFKDKMSTKSLILAGNVEQALKNIYAKSSKEKEFLKAEVLSLREGLVKNNPYTVTKVIAEFALTFDQNVISPDARLFSSVQRTKKLDEMPVYPKSLKVSEYRFDPNSPNQRFKVPIKTPIINNLADDGEEGQKSSIALPSLNFPITENQSLASVEGNAVNTKANDMQELQNFLESEQSLAPSANQQTGSLGSHQLQSAKIAPGGTFGSEIKPRTGGEISKRSQIPSTVNGKSNVPYILRLFFWKDMLARRKRQSTIEQRNAALLRRRRGDIENEKEKRTLKRNEELEHEKTKRRFDRKQIRLTEESSFERRFMKKVKRKTKDLTTEKELKRSKRLDPFEDFD